MLDFVTALWLGFVGACIGSFLNVVAYRMPLGMSVVWKPSHCPRCGHNIRARDNLPILGWLLLHGRCRDCGELISPRYAIVEGAMGIAFFVLAYAEIFTGAANLPGPLAEPSGALHTVVFPDWRLLWLFAFHATLLSLLMAAGLIDQDKQPIPRRFVAFAVVIIGTALFLERWYFYPERTRNLHEIPWKAAIDALLGALWGATAWLVPLALTHRRASTPTQRFLRNAAIASAIAGGFLGLRPIVRIFVLWLLGLVAGRGFKAATAIRLSPLLILWAVVLLHIACWGPLAKLFSW